MVALKITYRSSAFAGQVVEVDQPVIRLGRDPNRCDVLFDEEGDRVVSREHAELRWEGHALVMEPMPGKVLLRGGVLVQTPVSVFSGDVFEFAGPGGPAIEICFDYTIPSPPLRTLQAAQFSAVAQARRATDEVEAPTEKQLPKFLSRSAEQSADVTAPAPHPPPFPDAAPPPVSSAASDSDRTPRPSELEPQTTFLPVVPTVATPALPRNRRTRQILVAGTVTVALIAGAFFAWFQYSSAQARRRANERVERLKEAFKDIPNGGGDSLDDWQKEGSEEPVTPTDAAKTRTDPSSSGGHDAKSLDTDAPRAQARQLFAEWKRLELERLALGGGKDREVSAKRARIDERRRRLRTDYEARAASVREATDAQTATILTAARHLGECDAALPASLVERTLRYATSMSAAERSQLEHSLKRAKEHRYTPTITAALGDQGLPLELFFVPHLVSQFDELKVGEPTPSGLPKGMWQLSPNAARKQALKLGPDKDLAGYDPADDRHRYEKETKAAAKLARDLYLGPAAGSALLVLSFWSNGDPASLMAARKNAGLAAPDADVSLVSLWEKGKLGRHANDAVQALATVAMASHPEAFGLNVERPFVHVEPEDRR